MSLSDELHNYRMYFDDMILRDYLARDRTVLANERTLLSYIRTFLGFLATGGGLLKFFETYIAQASGYILIAISPVILVIGIIRYLQMRKQLRISIKEGNRS